MSELITQPKITNEKIISPVSYYSPEDRTRERFKQLKQDYSVAQSIMNGIYEEFGDMSLTDRENVNQKMFNQHKPAKSNDPDLQWHSDALKPIIRNKVISIVAHITSNVLYPNIIAQNDEANEDKDMAVVMRDAVIWACEQSGYEDMFIDAIQEMCVNPAIILFQDYTEVKRKIKEKGKVGLQEIVDEIYSGFVSSIVPSGELYIGNFYEPNIQKQPFLIRRKIIDYTAAERKYGKAPDFEFVRPGVRVFYSAVENLFYDVADDEQENRLVEEVIYYNQYADLELVIVNGVMITDPDEGNRRADKLYPFSKSVYETYNARCFYGMSLVQKLEDDENLINTLYRMIIDGTYLQLMPAVMVYGETDVNVQDFTPRSITTFSDPNTKVEPMQLGGNLNAGMNVLQLVENSMAESSKQEYAPKSDTTAREITYMEEQMKIMLGRTGKMVASLVRDFGSLLVSSIAQYIPIAQLSEITGDTTRLKYPALFLADDKSGEKKSKKIEFTNELPEAGDEQELEKLELTRSQELHQTEDKLGMSIIQVRPEAFRNMKYSVKVSPGFISQNTKFAKSMMLYDRLVGDPEVDQKKLKKQTILKELLPGQEDELLIEEEDPILNEAQKVQNKQTARPQAGMINKQAFTQI